VVGWVETGLEGVAGLDLILTDAEVEALVETFLLLSTPIGPL
jgi:hypothetical protein